MAKTYKRWSYTIRQETTHQHRPYEAWFPSYGHLTIKENFQSVHLEFPCSWSATRIVDLCLSRWQKNKAAGSPCIANYRQFAHSVQTVKLVKRLSTRRLKWPTCIWCLAEFMVVNVKDIVCTKNIFCSVKLQTEKLFPQLIDGWEKMGHLMCSQKTIGNQTIKHLNTKAESLMSFLQIQRQAVEE
jgi:hypothetical protein